MARVHVVHVDGVRLRLWTSTTNGTIVHPQVIYEYGEPWWDDIDGGKPKNSDKNLSQRHSVHHKSHIDQTRRKPGPPQ
jgi:hypothetical protein